MSSNETPSGPIAVGSVLAMMLDQMAAIAWSKLGLQPDMVTGQIAGDLDEAKLAIDAAGDLAARLTPLLDDEDQRQISNLMRDLKTNYMAKMKEAGR